MARARKGSFTVPFKIFDWGSREFVFPRIDAERARLSERQVLSREVLRPGTHLELFIHRNGGVVKMGTVKVLRIPYYYRREGLWWLEVDVGDMVTEHVEAVSLALLSVVPFPSGKWCNSSWCELR